MEFCHSTVRSFREKKLKQIPSFGPKKLKPIPNIPEEILSEILSWLPVKSLLRFTGACKSWHTLVSDPQFIDSHLKRSIENHEFSLFITSGACFDIHSPVKSQSLNQPRNLQFALGRNSKIIGSCNGLVCLFTISDSFLLLNPCTGAYHELPESPAPTQYGGYTTGNMYAMGFGYSSLTREYKVIRFTYFFEGKTVDIEKSIVQVYTVGTNSWRRTQDGPMALVSPGIARATLHNGSLHWIASINSYTSSMILAMDITKETFCKVPLPEFTEWYSNKAENICISVSRGRICLFRNTYKKFELWVMMEYGVSDSWIKQYHITPPTMLLNYFTHFRYLQTCEVLLMTSNEIIVFDSMKGSFRDLMLTRDSQNLNFFDVMDYVGSLVSPLGVSSKNRCKF